MLHLLFQILFVSVTNGRTVQIFFNSLEWTSTITTDVNIDTFAIREIELHAGNNLLLSPIPIIQGFSYAPYLIDRNYDQSAYAIEQTIYVKWEFTTATAVDYIRVITNCADNNPSPFCDNTQFIFLLAGQSGLTIANHSLTGDIQKIKLNTWLDDCDNNTLILDDEDPYPICDISCSQCLKYVHITGRSTTNNDHRKIQYSPSINNAIKSYTTNSSNSCECPLYDIELVANYTFDIDGNEEQKINTNGNDDLIQITLKSWMDEDDISCRQMYKPNTDDFISIHSDKGLYITITFNHELSALFSSDYNDSLVEEFELELQESLETLLALSWIWLLDISASESPISNTNLYNNTIIIKSNDQKTSSDTDDIQIYYNYWYRQGQIQSITLGLVADYFDTDESLIFNFTSITETLHTSGSCKSNWIYKPSTTPSTALPDGIVILIVICGGIVILIATGFIYACYHKEICCFKPDEDEGKNWNRHDDDNNDDIAKKNKKLDNNTNITNTTTTGKSTKLVITYQDPIPTTKPTGMPSIKQNVSTRVIPHQPQMKMFNHSQQINQNSKSSYLNASVSHVPAPSGDTVYHSAPSIRLSKLDNKFLDARSSYKYNNNDINNAVHSAQSSGQYSEVPTTDTSSSNETSSPQYIPNDDKTIDIPTKKAKGLGDILEDGIKEATDSHRVYEFQDFKKELKLLKCIGVGSFGKVYKARWESNDVAVKIFSMPDNNEISNGQSNSIQLTKPKMTSNNNNNNKTAGGISVKSDMSSMGIELAQVNYNLNDELYKELHSEIILATSIPYHPNIVRIMGFCRNPISVIMEYMPGGSVQRLVYGLTSRKEPSVAEKLIILLKSCGGLKELTHQGLHHRDIAARNILLGQYDSEITMDTAVKITDFGMTRKDNQNELNNNQTQKTKAETGPYKWMAPESIQDQIYNEKTDIYMFGITIWEIMYGREPYENVDAINAAMQACMKNERPEFLWDLPYGLKTLITKCWDQDSKNRPIFKDIFKSLKNVKDSHQKEMDQQNAIDDEIEQQPTTHSINSMAN